MASIKYLLSFTAGDGDLPIKAGSHRNSLNRLANKLKTLASGANSAAWSLDCRNTAVAATGTLTLSTASGTVGGTINGVTVTVTASGGDAATATAIAAAINASTNALVQYLVTASASGSVVTITSSMPGKTGNCITLAASGTGVTASGARLTGGSEDAPLTFSF